MTLFFDDFERANGAPGNGWSDLAFVSSISGGALVSTNAGVVYNTNTYEEHRHDVTVHMSGAGFSGIRGGPAVRLAAGGITGFCLVVKGTTRPYTLAINSNASVNGTTLASVSLDVNLPPMYALRLVWEDGHMAGYYNDTLMIETDNASNFNQRYAGLTTYVAYAPVLDFSCVLGTAPGLSVTPDVIPNYGACSTVTLTGTNTAWTPGTPGSPTFTVNHGTISAQTITSATSATLTYCPGSWLGAILFADPSTGQSAGAVVTSDPAIINPGGAALSDSIVAYLQRSADAETDSTIINRNESFTAYGVTKTISESIETIHGTLSEATFASGGQAGILALIIQVFDLLNGGLDWGGAATIFGNTSLIKSGVDDLATTLADVQGPGGVSLAVLAAALSDLRGTGSPSLADVLSAASGGGDYTAILDAITDARGSGLPSLATLVSSLGAIRTEDAYTLGSVKGWIDGLPHGGDTVSALAVVALVAALALAIPTGGASIAAEAVAVGAGPLLDIATLVEIVSVLGELAGIASNIESIRDSLGPSQLAAPVWPGDGLATLGTSHALADGLIVDGPMHGLIVTIDGHPNGAGKYAFGSVMSWQHCGAVVFADDSGHYERAESFGLPSQIITPRSMAKAASATVRLNGGWSGTIRGWTVTP